MDWNAIWNTIVSTLKSGGLQVLWAILALVGGIILIKIFIKIMRMIFAKTKADRITVGFCLSCLKFLLYVLLIIIVLQMLGVPITGIIAVISAAGLAVGLALQNSLSNVASGIILITTKPFKEGDYIVVDGVEGKVSNIRILTTTILTTDNKKIVLPNSNVVNNSLTNFSGATKRRVNFDFGVAYDSDCEQVKKIVYDVMISDGRVYMDPKPFVALKTLGESSIGFFAYCWCDSGDYWDVFYYVMENVFNEFKRNKINIPFNQMEVRMISNTVKMPIIKRSLPERKEKKRAVHKIGLIDGLIKAPDSFKEKMILKSMSKREKKKYLQNLKTEKQLEQEVYNFDKTYKVIDNDQIVIKAKQEPVKVVKKSNNKLNSEQKKTENKVNSNTKKITSNNNQSKTKKVKSGTNGSNGKKA